VAHGGKRPGAGRKPGSKDKATATQVATLSDLARAHTETAINVLVQVAQASESDAARVSAANAILDRGYGKPTQLNEHTGKDGGPIQTEDLTENEIARRIAFTLTRATRPTVN
jgi:hypothetical protein